ncbi:MAG: hypothetical protein EHM48_03840 [Planctomycetaceae bacterium]|nr:MAG: hypothetical protein EHM48_03840 [Planctomycetaceae bacterium]
MGCWFALAMFGACMVLAVLLGLIIAKDEYDMDIEVGQRVKVVGPGVHCGDKYMGYEGVICFIEKIYGVFVDFSETEGRSSKWFPPTSLKLVTDDRIDLSTFEIEELYAAVMAIDKILAARLVLINMGLATDDELDVGGIFEALRRELPLREGMFRALHGDE